MPIHIRPATPDDIPILLQFEQGLVASERPYDSTLRPDPIHYYDLDTLIASTEAEVVVAEFNGVLIGSGYAKKKASDVFVEPSHHAYLGFMFVVPEHRGRGVNQLLLNALLAWAKANDLPELHLQVYAGNEPALRAYEKAGFTPHILEMRLNLNAL